MSQQDVLKVANCSFRKVVVKLDRSTVAAEEKTLVHPVSDEEEDGCGRVHDWQAT